jgi:hypothetical protein
MRQPYELSMAATPRPRSGAETRKHCQTKIQETADMLMRQAEDVKTVERGN